MHPLIRLQWFNYISYIYLFLLFNHLSFSPAFPNIQKIMSVKIEEALTHGKSSQQLPSEEVIIIDSHLPQIHQPQPL